MTTHDPAATPIAIVGLSALTPGATDVAGFWRCVLTGQDLITDVPASHWLVEDYYDPDPTAEDKTYGKRGAFLSPVAFDTLAFGMPPNSVAATDTTQLLALIAAEQVLADATGGDLDSLDRDRVSVVLGTAPLDLLVSMSNRLQRPVWIKALREHGIGEAQAQAICDSIAGHYVPWQEASFPGLLSNVVAGRIANRFDLHGTNHTVDAACASSLAALSSAMSELQLGRADMVVTGGVDTLNDILMYMCFSKTPALSPTGDCRPFSDAADGTMLGEGLVMFALKRLADAERDGNSIYAVIRGLGTSSDGRSTAIYAPLADGQSRALNRAYETAGYGPDTVELIEAHGTGTVAGDAAEVGALRSVFEATGRTDRQWCAVGSVKSQIGHTKSAAGAAGLLKAVLAVQHGVLPPTIKVDRLNPRLELDGSPLYVNTQARPWIRDGSHPRRAGVSSFGFGGSNFHVTVEEYGPGSSGASAGGPGDGQPAKRLRSLSTELVLLGAATAGELVARCGEVAALDQPLALIARDSQADGWQGAQVRLGIVASDRQDLAAKLAQAATLIEKTPGSPWSVPAGIHYGLSPVADGSIAFLFPGQGSQYVGMGADVAMAYPQARSAWDQAADVPLGDQPLHRIVFPPPAFSDADRTAQQARLTATEWAQPALAVTSLALLRILDALGVTPDCVAGHSFGELVALHVAGAYDQPALLRLARLRGELMRDAASVPGAMLAVTGSSADAKAIITDSGVDQLWLANDNGPAQVVLSGTTTAVEAAAAHCERAGIQARRINAATAFHSPIVAQAAGPLLEFLRGMDVRQPRLPAYGNAEAAPYPADPDTIRQCVAAHLSAPVRFTDEIEAMYAAGVRTFIEAGAGATLTGLVGGILGDRPHLAVSLDRKGRDGVTSLHNALALLAVRGVDMNLQTLWDSYDSVAPPQQPRKSGATLMICGANYGRPYPPAAGAAQLPPAGSAAQLPPAGSAAQLPPPSQAPEPAPPVTVAAVAAVAVAEPPAPSQAGGSPPGAVTRTPAPRQAPQPPTSPDAGPSAPGQPPQDVAGQPPADVAAPREVAQPEPPQPGLSSPTAASLPSQVDSDWLYALQEAHRETTEAHASYQRLMAESHAGFLQLAENSLARFAAASHGEPQAAALVAPAEAVSRAAAPEQPESIAAPAPVVPVASPAPTEPAVMEGPPQRPPALVPDAATPAVQALHPAPAAAAPTPAVVPAVLAEPAEPATPAAPGGPAIDLASLVLSAVAEATGYPADMLADDMALEADLGIDSIKRVQILSKLREAVPGLPELTAADVAKFTTLGSIITALQETTGTPAAAPTAQTVAPAPPAAAPAAPGGPAIDLASLVLSAVAEATGYPADMLADDMALEADLGIDSIKRVQILSKLREAVPGLPELTAADVAKFTTLGSIITALQETTGTPAAAPATEAGDSTTSADVVTATDGAPEAGQPLTRQVTGVTSAPACGLAMANLSRGQIAVTDDGTGLAQLVVDGLAAHRVAATAVSQVPADAPGVIFLGGMRQVDTAEAAIAVNREAFQAARTIAARAAAEGGVFVTVQDTGGDFGLSARAAHRAWLGGLAGLALTAAQEWPLASVRAIDCERGHRSAADVAAAIVGELLTGGATPQVGLPANGTRVVPVVTRSAPGTAATPHVGPDSVIVATGGARGVTAVALRALAKACRPAIALLGRTALTEEPPEVRGIDDERSLQNALIEAIRAQTGAPPAPAQVRARVAQVRQMREIRETIDALRRAGSRVRYLAVDVCDADALTAALADVRREWGPITGLIHGAGVLADKTIADKADEQFARVFDTKVAGLRALLAATAADPLRTICLFSSVAGRYGNVGQSDYAMANAVLDQVASTEAARRPDCLVRAIAWGPWQGGMVTPALAGHFRDHGISLIEPEAGAQAFVAELSGGCDEVRVEVAGDEFKPLGGHRAGLSAEIRVNSRSHPHLDHHRVADVPVVPVALVLDWFAAHTRETVGHSVPLVVRDLNVLRGIGLDHFGNGGHRLTVRGQHSRLADRPHLTLELAADGDTPHYRASVDLDPAPGAGVTGWVLPDDLAPTGRSTIYDGDVLFHGPSFQALRSVHGVSASGAAADVAGVTELSWPGGPWRTDPAAIDGGLQLALLWAEHVLGVASLPMSVRECRIHRDGPADGMLRCVLRAGAVSHAHAECDIALLDQDGAARAELMGVTVVARPS